MSVTVESSTIVRTSRAIAFRVAAGLVAVVFIVLFGTWQAILTPWLRLQDDTVHGWQRTGELHMAADAASGVLMLGVGVGALILAIRPFHRSVLVSWTASSLAVISLGMVASTLLQGHDGVSGALLGGVVVLCMFVAPLLLLHPERRAILSGGTRGHAPGPTRSTILILTLVGGAAAAGAMAVAWWRMAGGFFENPAEDDAVSLAMLGVVVAIGCILCALGREGWRALATLLAGMVIYCVAAGLSIALV